MPKTARPRRSVLYMPGSNARALEKAKNITADGLILDLEDAVAPDAREAARRQVCQAVKDGGYGMRELIIRVNGLATPWGYEDIVQASRSGCDAILLPKVESADAIRHMESIMRASGAPASTVCHGARPPILLRAPAVVSRLYSGVLPPRRQG